MQIVKTGLDGVHFVNDDWRDFALVVEFSTSDAPDDIKLRFAAAAAKAVQLADVLAQDLEEKAARKVIQFPG